MNVIDVMSKSFGVDGSSAARPTGVLVLVTRQGGLRHVRGAAVTAWQPALQDIIADDWELLSAEGTAAMIAALKIPPAGIVE